MKILLINNNTQHLTELEDSLKEHDVEIRKYRPGLDFSCGDKNLVILSGGGGEGLEIYDEHKPGKLWYQDQMEFVRTANKPVLGICMGFEVIARAYGAKVRKMPQGLERFIRLQTTSAGQKLVGHSTLKQFEAHDWHVPTVPTEFEVLATSKTGIEIIKHKTRPIFATQFHPEKGGTINLVTLLASRSVT